MKLIGLHGHAGAGKDTFAESFHYYKYKQFAFADPVKEAAAAAFGIHSLSFYNREIKEIDHPFWNLSPRKMAQLVGTECFREVFGAGFWIRRMEWNFLCYYNQRADVRAVITDVRFPEEIDYILSNQGIIIHLTRPGADGTVGIQNHSSEQTIDFTDTKYIKGVNYEEVINDSSISELHEKAKQLILKHNL